jgi:uncharacterized repeat protein (TIGR03843 family)
LSLLLEGEVEVQGRMPWSSNHTFLVTVTDSDGTTVAAVYKPARGERPLWDFPDGLYRREAAAYQLSAYCGWDLVPETVVRAEAPLGEGSLQRFVDADFEQHYFTLLEDPAHHAALRRIAVLDLLLNNADRKSGHCIVGRDGRVWAIDNGLSFNVEPKLRTVIWDFAGEKIPHDMMEGIDRVASRVPEELAEVLHHDEVAALKARAQALCARPSLPAPHPDRRHYPWPLV